MNIGSLLLHLHVMFLLRMSYQRTVTESIEFCTYDHFLTSAVTLHAGDSE